MAEIRITGFEELEREVKQTRELVGVILHRHKMQPEKDALMACINAMQTAIEDLILAYEDVVGHNDISKKARHAMNAAHMLMNASKTPLFDEWGFPEEVDEENVTKARMLVKKPAPTSNAPRRRKK